MRYAMRTEQLHRPMPSADLARSTALVTVRDATLRARIAMSLRTSGYDAIETHDDIAVIGYVRAARRLADRLPPVCLVVFDVRQPYDAGLRKLEAMCSTDTKVPIIALVSSEHPHLREQALQAGAAAVVQKPVSIERLIATARSIAFTH